jgi:signal transduction histidine kinase
MKGGPPDPVVSMLSRLAVPSSRAEAVRELSQFLGCDDVLLFVPDQAVNLLLPAPGFPQTLPNGLEWQAFVQSCRYREKTSGELISPITNEKTPVMGAMALDGAVAVLLGSTAVSESDFDRLLELMPLLAASLCAERQALLSIAEARTARMAAKESRALAGSLDQVRSQLQDSIELLLTQKTELAHANSDLQQFAYITSHDLQEPLRVITSFSQLLSRRYKGKLDAEADLFLDYISASGIRMKELINDVLSYAGLSTSEPTPVPVDFGKALQTALLNLGVPAQKPSVTVTHDELPVLPAEVGQIVQLFQNLVGNAIKYRSEADPKIHISATRRELDWLFAVADNGIGIEANYLKQIFGVFKRLHRGPVPGTGIGLAICKRIAEKHGGKIWAESQPGKGSTFYFTLPLESTPTDPTSLNLS